MPLRVFRGYSPPDVLSAVASSAVSSVVLSAVSAAPALFPCSSCAGRTTRIGGYAKGRCKIALQRPRCRNLFVMPYPAGKSCRDSGPENLAGVPVRRILHGRP